MKRASRYDAPASPSPSSPPRTRAQDAPSRIRAHLDDQQSDRPQQQQQQQQRHLPDAFSGRSPAPQQHYYENHGGEMDARHDRYGGTASVYQVARSRSRSSPLIVLDAPSPYHQQQQPQSVHHGSSATSSVYWTPPRNRHAREQASVRRPQRQEDDMQREAQWAQDAASYGQRLAYNAAAGQPPYTLQPQLDPQQYQELQTANHPMSGYELYDATSYDELRATKPRRSYSGGKRKASDEDGFAGFGALRYYDSGSNVHLTMPDGVNMAASRDPVDGLHADQRSGRESSEAQTRRMYQQHPQTHLTLQQPQTHHQFGGYRRSDSPLSSSSPTSYWLQHHHHRQEEEETKMYAAPGSRRSGSEREMSLSPLHRHASRLPTATATPVATPGNVRSVVQGNRSPSPPAPEQLMLPPPSRVITNASRNITFAMLQPHFERPLQEAALRFGVCTTLLKKICRKNGIKNWPFRRICGLYKSIASMEKQVHYFDGEQKRSYADQLYKLQLELAAYTRTGNALTPEFVAKIEAEGGLYEDDAAGTANAGSSIRDAGSPEEKQEHAETKTEDLQIAFGYSYDDEDDDRDGQARTSTSTTLSPPSLSAVSTRVSVSSYKYASPSNQEQDEEDHMRSVSYMQQRSEQQQYASVRQVMASTVDLGYDDDVLQQQQQDRYARSSPESHRQQQFQAQQQSPHASQHRQQAYHHHHTARPHSSRAATTTRYLAAPPAPLQRSLPSLSFMLHRQSLSHQNQQVSADATATESSHSPPQPANPSFQF